MLKLKLIEHTPSPEKVIATAAKLCYSNSNIDELSNSLDEKAINNFLNKLMSIGHESPLEHCSFTFAIEGVSRITEQQLTRHRIASYSIQSGRYVNRKNAKFAIPPSIKNNKQALSTYIEQCENSIRAYNKLIEELKADFIKDGMSKEKAEKQALEDARYIFPNSLETKIIVTMNVRSLINFFKHRCCNRAQWEIRELAFAMLRECKKVAPTLFSLSGPSCISGKCPEGSMSCQKQHEVKAKLKEL